MYDLNELVEEDTGWELLVAEGINARGAITGYGRIDGRTRAFLLVPAGR